MTDENSRQNTTENEAQPADAGARLAGDSIRPGEPQCKETAARDVDQAGLADLPAVAAITPEEAAELRAKASEAEANYDRYLRALADLENYRKRVARDREQAEKYRHEPLLRELLPVLDGLDLAFAAPANASDGSAGALRAGFVMINQQLRNALKSAGLEEIDAVGKQFDPKLHEAVGHEESSETADGHVLRQLRKGFKYRDRLLRPATVIVAQKPSA